MSNGVKMRTPFWVHSGLIHKNDIFSPALMVFTQVNSPHNFTGWKQEQKPTMPAKNAGSCKFNLRKSTGNVPFCSLEELLTLAVRVATGLPSSGFVVPALI